MNKRVIAWKDYGIPRSIVLGCKDYSHQLEEDIIYLPRKCKFEEGESGIVIHGDGRIEFKGKVYSLPENMVAVINSVIEFYKKEEFEAKFLDRKIYK